MNNSTTMNSVIKKTTPSMMMTMTVNAAVATATATTAC